MIERSQQRTPNELEWKQNKIPPTFTRSTETFATLFSKQITNLNCWLTDDVFALLLFQSINSIFEAQGWDFEVTSGEISSVTVGIPWNCLMSEDSYVEVNNLRLCLRPQPRAKDDGKYF